MPGAGCGDPAGRRRGNSWPRREVTVCPKGSSRSHRAILACRHAPERTEEELQILVDHGVKVLDVIVEHPIYGELRGSLMIESRADVQDFSERARASHASLLSSLTGGVHLHTVEASRPEMISRAKAQLASARISAEVALEGRHLR